MQHSAIRTRVIERLNEYNAGVAESSTVASFASATITARINEVYRDLVAECVAIDPSKFETTTTMTYTANAEDVTLPVAVQGRPLTGVEVLSGTDYYPLVEGTRFQRDSLSRLSIPYVVAGETVDFDYMLEGQTKIALQPKPTQALTLRLRFVADLTDLSADADVPSLLPAEQHATLALGTALSFMRESGDPPRSLQDEYAAKLERLRQWVARSPVSGPRFVRE